MTLDYTVSSFRRRYRSRGFARLALLRVLVVLSCLWSSSCTARAPAPAPDPPQPHPTFVTKVRERDRAPMVFVAAGPFRMGSSVGELAAVLQDCRTCPKDWFDWEKVPHQVDLPSFWIDKYEVTNRQYRLFMEAGGYGARPLWTAEGWAWKEREARTQPQYLADASWAVPDLPVVGVVWYEAVAYCRWASARLPTEAEWEKAAGWNPLTQRKSRYPWGETWDKAKANTAEQGLRHTTPVGTRCEAGGSAYGACDMAGNVWEWCSTLHQPYPYNASDGREDLEAKGTRTLRGGSWINERHEARTAYRLPPFPGDFILFDPTNGFRCAMDGQ